MHLFIDTNAYLSFYHYTKDDTLALEKLFQELQQGNIQLHVPRQVREEWTRNRDARLSVAAKEFQKTPFSREIPRHMQGLSMSQAYAKAVAEAKKAREVLIAEAKLKARTYLLDVDIYIKSLFDAGTPYDHDDAIFATAKLRADRGNPPGKPGSYGDQYNWEMLLTRVPDADLYVVTKDSDFLSALDGNDERGMAYPNAFLREEWNAKKGGFNLYVFEGLKAVLEHYEKTIGVEAAPPAVVHVEPAAETEGRPNQNGPATDAEPVAPAVFIENVDELRDLPQEALDTAVAEDHNDGLTEPDRVVKQEAMQRLINSPTFQETHAAVAELRRFLHNFTATEANALCEGADDNTQINWIITDDDVFSFYSTLVSLHFSDLRPSILDRMIDVLGMGESPEDDEQGL
ncbi:hypothetical protein AU476_12805 [Cupriavidus sp. UYMSc13B]|nr:hypothetical protein AU476_12805 [Cupriavidus sp. UYMSc13B]